MGTPFETNNPGIGGLDELTSDEEALVEQLASLTLSQGDILYVDSAGDIVNLGAGTSGDFLQTQGAGANPQWATASGSGGFSGPVSSTDNAIVRFDGTTGDTGQNSGVTISDLNAVSGVSSLTIDASGSLSFGAISILSDSAGTTTLQNIDAIDATTETTIEAAIDTLANLTSAASLATVGTITTGVWNGTDIAIADGGTGSSTAAGARTNLGLVIGTDVMAFDQELQDFADSSITVTTNAIAGVSTLGLGGDITLYEAVNDGNPEIRVGSSDAEEFHIQAVYDTGAQTLDYVQFETDAASATADKGEYRFNVDGVLSATIDDGGIEIKTSGSLSFGAVDILTDSAGTTTLSNIDALDATTEATIEAAIDTLANLASIGSFTGVLRADSGTLSVDSDVTDIVAAASTTAAGKVELATTAETNTGTDTTRAVTPDSLSSAVKSIMLTAAGGAPLITAGCSEPTKVEAATNDINYWVLDFDATTEEHAFWNFPMPDNWDAGVVNATFYWTNAAGLTTETVDWGIAAGSWADNDAIDAALGTEVITTDTWLAQGDMHISAASTDITVANATAGEWTTFVVARKVATDNLTGDARLIAVKIEYTIDKYSE